MVCFLCATVEWLVFLWSEYSVRMLNKIRLSYSQYS